MRSPQLTQATRKGKQALKRFAQLSPEPKVVIYDRALSVPGLEMVQIRRWQRGQTDFGCSLHVKGQGSLHFSLAGAETVVEEKWYTQGSALDVIHQLVVAERLPHGYQAWEDLCVLLKVPELAQFYLTPRGLCRRDGRLVDLYATEQSQAQEAMQRLIEAVERRCGRIAEAVKRLLPPWHPLVAASTPSSKALDALDPPPAYTYLDEDPVSGESPPWKAQFSTGAGVVYGDPGKDPFGMGDMVSESLNTVRKQIDSYRVLGKETVEAVVEKVRGEGSGVKGVGKGKGERVGSRSSPALRVGGKKSRVPPPQVETPKSRGKVEGEPTASVQVL